MAIASNSSEQEVKVEGGGVTLYVGIAPVKVIAVNPSMAELNAIGVPAKMEPQYTGLSIGGDEFNKIVVWIEHTAPDFKTKVEFLVKPEPKVSQSGKTQWTNNVGQFAYAESKASEAYDWFKDEGVRKAFNGEEKLMDFVKAFANVAAGDDCYLETWQEVAKGNVKELRELFNLLPENRVRVLLGVKDEKYQQVYDKHFGRLKPKRDDLFIKKLNDDYGAFKAEYNKTLLLEQYSPTLVAADEEPDAFKTDDAPSAWDN